MAEKFDEFLEEVESDIRQEKLLNLWKQYGKFIIGGVTAVLLLIAAYNFWGQYERNKRVQMAEKLIAAQDFLGNGEADKALAVLNSLSDQNHKIYQPLALFQKAGILLQEGPQYKPAEAIAIYQQLAANKKLDSLWRDLATLMSIMTSMDQPDAKIETLIDQLNPLMGEQNPWHYFAQEMNGILLYRKGESDKAIEAFARLVQDTETPPGISMRARLMVQIVSTGMKD